MRRVNGNHVVKKNKIEFFFAFLKNLRFCGARKYERYSFLRIVYHGYHSNFATLSCEDQ